MLRHGVLDENHRVVLVEGLKEWAAWFEHGVRHVADEQICGVRVSTVFLGLDHGFHGDEPLWFETMVFGGALDQEMWRCSTWDQAVEQHAAVCVEVRRRNIRSVG
jgi:hypothetical protein